ncbi:hypothetical protein BKA63DRAFT_92779 [Paraphoma chrysanthemicola]|nr:hypothetical protein BKA63DRAFT_92779 [Paraphoma chrysanthemicola]
MAASFASLPISVLSTIFSQLHESDHAAFQSLRSVARMCRSPSEDVVFRQIKLTGMRDIETTFLERLYVPDETVGDKVQCIRLVPPRESPAVCEQLAALLADRWNRLRNLQELRWESPHHIPPLLLTLLSGRTGMRLTYINNNRVSYAMDKLLLSSPYLHRLEYTTLAYVPQAECASEMSELRKCLLQARNLKTLNLRVGVLAWSPNDDYQVGPLNLQFQSGDQFPALEELTLDSDLQNYFPTTDHCKMWSHCMDWSRLHTLDFGFGSPIHLLEALTGRVAQLRTFKFGFWPTTQTGAASKLWNASENLGVIERFLVSIDALQNVRLHSWDDDAMGKVRPALLAKHGSSLRYLEAKLHKGFDTWQPEHFAALAEKAPGLKELRARMGLQEVKKGRKTRSIWPDVIAASDVQNTYGVSRLKGIFSSFKKHLDASPKPSPISPRAMSSKTLRFGHSALTSLRRLTHLHLEVILEWDADQLISFPTPYQFGVPSIKHQFATELVLRLWENFGSDSPIEQIEIVFIAPEVSNSTKEWFYTVSKRWVKRAKDGIWEWRVVVDMREEGSNADPNNFDPFG